MYEDELPMQERIPAIFQITIVLSHLHDLLSEP